MRYVIDIYGVLVPALLLWIIVAYVLSAHSAPDHAALRASTGWSGIARCSIFRSVVCLLGVVVYLSEYLA